MNTVKQFMTFVGVDDVILFQWETNAQRLAKDMFDDDFTSYIDKHMKMLTQISSLIQT